MIVTKKLVLFAAIFTLALLASMPPARASGAEALTLDVGIETSLYWGEYADQGSKTWASSDPGVVSIVSFSGNNCMISTISTGPCSVIAEVTYTGYETQWIPYPWGGGYWGVVPVKKTDSFTYQITVVKPGSDEVAQVTIDAGSPTIGDTYTCNISLKTAADKSVDFYDYPALLWSSSNPNVVSVNGHGVIEAKSKGTAVITAQTPSGISGSCTVQVSDFTGYTAIATAGQLSDIRSNPDGKYYLANDIVFSSADFLPGGQFYNNGAGFLPIPAFTGVLNGRGYSVANLNINATGFTGLFSSAHDPNLTKIGLIKNLEIKNSTITGTGNTGAFVADRGVCYNCKSTNNIVSGFAAGGIGGQYIQAELCVNTSAVSGKTFAGGITGQNGYAEYCSNGGTVQALLGDGSAGGIMGLNQYGYALGCINTGAVEGNYCTGGICGEMSVSDARDCFNSGKITAFTYPYPNDCAAAGGISGSVWVHATIHDSYNTGEITLDDQCADAVIGGICGALVENDCDPGEDQLHLLNCYNAGILTNSAKNKGECAGISGTVKNNARAGYVMLKNCFYSSAAAAGVGYMPDARADNLTALSPSQMKAAASYSGFDFVNNWFLDAATTYAYPQLKSIQMKDSFTVSFNVQGGTAAAPVTAHYNVPISDPAAPKRTGYTFEGWYRDSAGTAAWNFETDRVTGDTTLFAKWSKNAYTVTFNSQGGSAVGPVMALYDTAIAAPAGLTRAGYAFAGWYREAACTHAWNFTTDKVTGSITLFAGWSLLPPAVPTGVKASPISYMSVKVSWAAAAGAGGYEIFRAASASGTYVWAGSTATTAITDTGLATGTTYYYKVRAYKTSGTAKSSSSLSSPVSAKPFLGASASVKPAPASYNSIKVTWSAVEGTTKYELYRATMKSGVYKLLTATALLSYTNTGVDTGTTYYYKVRAYRLVNSVKVYGADSPVASAVTKLAVPAAVKAARASSTSIKTSWGAVAGAKMYEIWRSTSASSGFVLAGTTTSASYTNTRLTTGKTYYYKVRAYRIVGSVKVYSAFSSVAYAKP